MHINPHWALITAAIIFAIIATLHLLRIIYKFQVIFAGKIIPLWVSGIGFIILTILAIWMLLASVQVAWAEGEKMMFTIQSSAFNDNGSIPSKYTCDGNNVSPPLSWKESPAKTKSFVLIVDDPDAPNGVWDHWIIFNIQNGITELPENTSLPEKALYGKNSWGKLAYGGPCPPNGEHRYLFKVYALDTLLNLPSGSTKQAVEAAMMSHVLAMTTLTGRYERIKG